MSTLWISLVILTGISATIIALCIHVTMLSFCRQVRDRLVKQERLALAQEVATKSGLDPAAVWTAWGMSCLRAGDYPGAREKFGRILKV